MADILNISKTTFLKQIFHLRLSYQLPDAGILDTFNKCNKSLYLKQLQSVIIKYNQ